MGCQALASRKPRESCGGREDRAQLREGSKNRPLSALTCRLLQGDCQLGSCATGTILRQAGLPRQLQQGRGCCEKRWAPGFHFFLKRWPGPRLLTQYSAGLHVPPSQTQIFLPQHSLIWSWKAALIEGSPHTPRVIWFCVVGVVQRRNSVPIILARLPGDGLFLAPADLCSPGRALGETSG